MPGRRMRAMESFEECNADPVDTSMVLVPDTGVASVPSALSRTGRQMVWGICVWSIIQLVEEISAADGAIAVWALLAGRALWIGLALGVMRGNVVAQRAFCFLCLVSVLAVASALAREYEVSLVFFIFSLTECLLKAAFLLVHGTNLYLRAAGRRGT